MSGTIPETVFMTFQMTFAVITPALIVGAFAERMKFSAMLVFMALWRCAPGVTVDGGAYGILDFAGGTVVHINAGVGASRPPGAGAPGAIPRRTANNLSYHRRRRHAVGRRGFNAGSEPRRGGDRLR